MKAGTLSVLLIVLTFLSTLYVGAGWAGQPVATPSDLVHGWTFAVPLMGILLAHEFGHYIAGRKHGVDISLPYFLPMPIFLLGTLGAVIRIRRPIAHRAALLDVGVAGPLAGLAVALPVLVAGLVASPVQPLEELTEQSLLQEGHSLLYMLLLYFIKGPIADGSDVMLTPTALAGWAGLLITMINLIPVSQLDGGHIAYALWEEKQNHYSRWVRRLLPVVAIAVGLWSAFGSYLEGERGDNLLGEVFVGSHWLVWALILYLMTRGAEREHPPTVSEPLSAKRKVVGYFTLGMFLVLFMPVWIRIS